MLSWRVVQTIFIFLNLLGDSNIVNSQGSVELLTPSEGEETSTVKSGWVEHTWSTFIERAEDDDEELLPGRERLSDFQQMKFRHFFYHVLDLNNDHVISEEDFTGLNSRVRHYMEWSINTAQYLILTEVSSSLIFLTPQLIVHFCLAC